MNLRLSARAAEAALRGRPWIAAQDQLSYRLPPAPGTLVRVQTGSGDFLGWAVSDGPGRDPAFRILSRDRRPGFDGAWWAGLVGRALGRRGIGDGPAPAEPLRLLNGEGDGVPGVVCDACCGQAFLSVSSAGMEPRLADIEAALVGLTRLRGLWRRCAGAGGAWGPWSRAPLAPASPARFEVPGPGPAQAVDLERDPLAPLPPWPVERRPWRAWAAERGRGRRVLALGALAGEARAAAGGAQRLEFLERGFIGAPCPEGFAPEVVMVDLPDGSWEPFGRFDAAKHAPRFLRGLAARAAPGALWLLTSGHRGLSRAEAWEAAWAAAGLPARCGGALEPGPDCPEPPLLPQARFRRAFIFGEAPLPPSPA